MIKIPNMDAIAAVKATDKKNKIPQPPKTVTSRHQGSATVHGSNAILVKRKSLDRARAAAGNDSMNVSTVMPSSQPGGLIGNVAGIVNVNITNGEKGRNAANTMQNSLVMRQFMQKKNFSSHHTQEIGGLRAIPTATSGAGTTTEQALEIDQDASSFSQQEELDSVQRLAYEAAVTSANLSAATGPGARTENLLRSGGTVHDSSLERPHSLIKSAGGTAGA